jgi:hypothetical protein
MAPAARGLRISGYVVIEIAGGHMRTRNQPVLTLSAIVILGVVACHGARAQGTVPPPARESVVRYTPELRVADLQGRPDSDQMEFANGARVRLGDLRRLTAFARELRAAPVKALPPALTARPAARGIPVNNADDLRVALGRPDSDTIELPSGRRLTVGQLKFLQPQVEKELGRPLPVGKAQTRTTDSTVKVGARSDWKSILQMPDTTVLEAPDGTRVTVGDVKRALREDSAPRAPSVRAEKSP